MSEVVLIKGANTGLGYATVEALLRADQPYHVLLCARSIEKARRAVEELESIQTKGAVRPYIVDVTNDESIEQLFREVERDHGRIDVLMNNAAWLRGNLVGSSFEHTQSSGSSLREIFYNTYDLNVAGAHIMTHTFAPLLIKSSNPRLLFLTSGASSLTETLVENISPALAKRAGAQAPPPGWPKEPQYFGQYAYRSAKAGLNMLMRTWERLLRNDNVKVWSVAPGLMATNMTGNREALIKLGAADPSVGAKVIMEVIEGQRDGEVGMVINATGVQPW